LVFGRRKVVGVSTAARLSRASKSVVAIFSCASSLLLVVFISFVLSIQWFVVVSISAFAKYRKAQLVEHSKIFVAWGSATPFAFCGRRQNHWPSASGFWHTMHTVDI
jgi:hypothetical protein